MAFPLSCFRRGDKEIRTLDPLLARQVLSQLSYVPSKGCRQPPALPRRLQRSTIGRPGLNRRVRDGYGCFPRAHRHRQLAVAWQLHSKTHLPTRSSLRKEVIQPHLPIRLPCYDFTPVIRPAFGCSLLSVGPQTSGISDSHGVTGGVYKTRERIHRGILIRDY